jgi:hypothetical protein
MKLGMGKKHILAPACYVPQRELINQTPRFFD